MRAIVAKGAGVGMNVEFPIKVLLAEDSEDDRFFMRRAIGRCSRFQIIAELDRGDDVHAYFAGVGEYADRKRHPVPDLLFHDATMPGGNAREFLAWLKVNPFPGLVVIVFTGSLARQQCEELVQEGADACYVKPGNFATLEKCLHEIENNMIAGHYQHVRS